MSTDTRELGRRIVDEALRLEKENILLRRLVEAAYNEGYNEGMKEHTSARGGKPWRESKACLALNPSAH